MATLQCRHSYFMKWNYEVCSAIAREFDAKQDFRERASGAFQWLRRNGLLESACAHMTPRRRSFTDDDIAHIAVKYDHRRAFKVGDQSAYAAATKRGILDTVCAHMSAVRRNLSDEQIFEIANSFTSKLEFLKSDYGAYQVAYNRGILDEACAHMDRRDIRRLSDDEVLSIARKHKTRNDFKLDDFGAYITAMRRGLIEAACAHMEYGATGFREDRPAFLYQFQLELADGQFLYKVGITNRKPRQRMITMGIQPGVKVDLTHAVEFPFGRDARIAEKRLHREMSAYRYGGPPVMKNGNTELFTVGMIQDWSTQDIPCQK